MSRLSSGSSLKSMGVNRSYPIKSGEARSGEKHLLDRATYLSVIIPSRHWAVLVFQPPPCVADA